jgi:hypothetical protein
MAEESKIEKISKDIEKFRSLDGVVIRQEMQPTKLRVGDGKKGAMLNDVVDKWLNRELTDEYLQQVKEENEITTKDIVREIAKRQIEKVMGSL